MTSCACPKVAYAGELPAVNAAIALGWAGDPQLRAYRCPDDSDTWHIGHPADHAAPIRASRPTRPRPGARAGAPDNRRRKRGAA